MNAIDVTVALPTWNSAKILWLQLESLCRQKTRFKFEVIVVEDPSENFAGKDYVLEFSQRINEAGGELVYISLPKWIPLGLKWKYIAEAARGDVYILAASDNFSSPDRIEVSANAMQHSDWFDVRSGSFYDIHSGRQAHWHCYDLSKTGLFMATKTKLMLQLNDNPPKAGVDTWIRECFQQKIYRSTTEFMDGLHTDGCNTISHHRKTLYTTHPRFTAIRKSVTEILPEEIYKRLLQIKKEAHAQVA